MPALYRLRTEADMLTETVRLVDWEHTLGCKGMPMDCIKQVYRGETVL